MRETKMIYTVEELAEALGIAKANAYALCRQPDFPAIRVSPRRIVIPVDGLKAWMQRNAGKSV